MSGAAKFLNSTFGVSQGGLLAWGLAGGAAYFAWVRPEQIKREAGRRCKLTPA